jgi:hypothetical protein
MVQVRGTVLPPCRCATTDAGLASSGHVFIPVPAQCGGTQAKLIGQGTQVAAGHQVLVDA